MPSITVNEDTVEVRFSRSEKALGLLRDLTVPRSAIVGAALVEDGRRAVRGWWRTGTSVPRLLHVGVWRQHGLRQVVVVRRGGPAVLIRLEGCRYDELLLAVADAPEVTRLLTSTNA